MTTRTKLKREEDVEREDGRREPAPPPAPVSQMLELQRTMGNQAAMALMARSVRATLAREPGTAEAPQANASISQAIADRDIGAIKAIDDFTPASDPQRFEMIAILLDQFWVGPRDEAALERIWASFGERLPAMMATHARVWWDCRDRGAELPLGRFGRDLQGLGRLARRDSSPEGGIGRGVLRSAERQEIGGDPGEGVAQGGVGAVADLDHAAPLGSRPEKEGGETADAAQAGVLQVVAEGLQGRLAVEVGPEAGGIEGLRGLRRELVGQGEERLSPGDVAPFEHHRLAHPAQVPLSGRRPLLPGRLDRHRSRIGGGGRIGEPDRLVERHAGEVVDLPPGRPHLRRAADVVDGISVALPVGEEPAQHGVPGELLPELVAQAPGRSLERPAPRAERVRVEDRRDRLGRQTSLSRAPAPTGEASSV